MDELNKLIARLKEIDERQAAIEAEADEKTGGNLSDEQRAEYDRLAAEYDETKAKADALKADLAKRAARANRASDFEVPALPRRTAANSASPPPSGSEDREKIPATAKRYGPLKHFAGTVGGRDAEERAYRFGMWTLARLSQSLPGDFRNASAEEWVSKNLTAHGSNDTTGAHNLIPDEFSRDMIDLREKRGVARRLLRSVPMTSDTLIIPRRTGGLTAYAVAENAAGTESNKSWDNVRLTAKDWMVIARMSAQLSADAAINLGDDLMGEIAYAFADKEDQCAFNGDGTDTYSGIRGIRVKLLDVDGSGTDSAGVKVASGNAFSEVVLSDFDKVVGALPQYADTPGAVWVMHRTFYYEVVEKLIQASGGVPAYEVRQGNRPRPLLKGYPVEFSQVFPSTESNSSVVAVLGDLSLGAAFGDRQQSSITFSTEASIGGQSVFERNQIAVRGVERFDINVHDVGSSSTPGPIVGLQLASS